MEVPLCSWGNSTRNIPIFFLWIGDSSGSDSQSESCGSSFGGSTPDIAHSISSKIIDIKSFSHESGTKQQPGVNGFKTKSNCSNNSKSQRRRRVNGSGKRSPSIISPSENPNKSLSGHCQSLLSPSQPFSCSNQSFRSPSQSLSSPTQSLPSPSQSLLSPSLSSPSQSLASPSRSLPSLSQSLSSLNRGQSLVNLQRFLADDDDSDRRGKKRRIGVTARERNLRRLESNERERQRMHSLNTAFQVGNNFSYY